MINTCAAWFQVLSAEAGAKRSKTLRRTKREWILPPAKLVENTNYTWKPFIAKVSYTTLVKLRSHPDTMIPEFIHTHVS